MKVAIIGTGRMGQALAIRCVNFGGCSKYDVSVGSRHPTSSIEHPGLSVPVLENAAALSGANIVVLAIPVSAFPHITSKYSELLQNVIVIDISNASVAERGELYARSTTAVGEANDTSSFKSLDPPSSAEWLQERLGSSVQVVKAFNNLGSKAIRSGNMYAQLETVAISNSMEALKIVQDFAAASGITVTHSVDDLQFSRHLERIQQASALKEWQTPFYLLLVLGLVMFIYCAARSMVVGKNLVQTCNSSIAWLSITGLSLTYLPGAIVRVRKIIVNADQPLLPLWFVQWLEVRKELGTLSWAAAFLHMYLTVFLLNPAYCDYLYDLDSHVLNFRGNWTILSGTIAFIFMTLPAVASLPGIGNKLNHRSWVFMQSTGGIAALILSSFHTITLGSEIWLPIRSWKFYMPPVSLAAFVLPCIVVFITVLAFGWNFVCRNLGRTVPRCHIVRDGYAELAVYQRV